MACSARHPLPMILTLYNPSHDEALAAGTPCYTPTRAATQQALAHPWLPLAWSGQGDVLLCFEQQMSAATAVAYVVGDPSRQPHRGAALGRLMAAVTAVEPWGWDAHIVALLSRLGVPRSAMPSPAWLDGVRRLSSRQTAVTALSLLRRRLPLLTVGESRWCDSAEAVAAAVDDFDGRAVMKTPWSSSGRGVFFLSQPSVAAHREAIVSKYVSRGGLALERAYRVAQDFGVEYAYRDGVAHYLGLSLFATREGGGYVANRRAAQRDAVAALRACLAAPAALDAVLAVLPAVLSEVLGSDYCGPLGVDMLVTADGALHPCVEINLRRTMGHVVLAE